MKILLAKFHPNNGASSFVQELDNYLAADGQLEDLIYHSCLNYLVRRLINTARYLYSQHGEYNFKVELRKYLRDYTRYSDRQKTEIGYALEKCLRYMDETENAEGDMNFRRAEAKRFNHNCYICGGALEYGGTNPDKIATADHVWPRSMGGLNDRDNIKIACGKCNNKIKRNRIDHYDYHYEAISLSSTEGDTNFLSELEAQYRVAVYAKSLYNCTICGQPAYRVGKLVVGRIDEADSWHFLNLVAYCVNCAGKS
ncbi:MAG: HNH endonuclease [Roseiflexaceae bacterium]|nr:HNH endonuclease [Roseiflexaceae bacterium]